FLQGPDTDSSSVAEVREAVRDRHETSVELLNYRKDGTTFWNALYISPIFDENKKLVYFFASQLDVSRRRDMEEALGQAQKMEALGQLTGGIAHDFNNLLQVMSGHVDLLEYRRKAGSMTDVAMERGLSNIRSSIIKTSTLTQQMLAFSRKQRLEGRMVNLNSLVGDLTDLVKETLGDGIEVRKHLAEDLGNCQLDSTQFEVALLNILVNARDAMPEGGTITLKTHNIEVDAQDAQSFSGLAPGQYVSLAVADTGEGIPPEIIKRVMDPFFTTKEEGKGTGLGLSMVYGFVKQSGGMVDIYSEVGVSTTVRMYFLRSGRVVQPPAQVTQRLAQQGGNETILVVDDRPEVASTSRDLLESLGYVVHVAHSAQEALDMQRHHEDQWTPDLLFSDVIMPGGMNGFGLAHELRKRLPDVRVLLTTGYAGPSDGISHNENSDFEILKKPYRFADLARRVRHLLDEKDKS
ncbi:MAG: response regulator, partial [Cytophagaceae bacterium]